MVVPTTDEATFATIGVTFAGIGQTFIVIFDTVLQDTISPAIGRTFGTMGEIFVAIDGIIGSAGGDN